jgi:hypothetical protein
MVLTDLLLAGATDRNKQVRAAGQGSQSISNQHDHAHGAIHGDMRGAVCMPLGDGQQMPVHCGCPLFKLA